MAEEKIWLRNDKGVILVNLTDERLDEALALMRESYYADEPVAMGTRLQECPQAVDEMEKLTLHTYRDGTSLVALKNGKVVGVAFNKVQSKAVDGETSFFDHFKEHECQTEAAKEYMYLMMRVDARKDVFEHYGVDKSMEVMFIVTSRSCRKQGVGLLLVQGAMEVARSKNLPLCSAIFSNNNSQKIGIALKWDQLITAYMSEFEFKGEPYSKFTGDNQTLVLMACRL